MSRLIEVCVLVSVIFLVKSEIDDTEIKELNVCLHKLYHKKRCFNFTSDSMQTMERNITGGEYSTIELNNNFFPVLHKELLLNVEDVENLWLDNCNILVLVPFGTFNNLNYRLISLDDNLISRIEYGVFTNHPRLNSLYIRRNRIEFIHKDAFTNMTYLQLINLSNNRLKYWNPDWFSGNIMAVLHFPNNLIEELPDSSFKFATVPPLVLNLNNNTIRVLSNNTFKGLSYVANLHLASNQLTEFGENLLRNTNLHFLDISDNKIECLPQNLSTVFKGVWTNITSNPFTCSCFKRIKDYTRVKAYRILENFNKTCEHNLD